MSYMHTYIYMTVAQGGGINSQDLGFTVAGLGQGFRLKDFAFQVALPRV